MVVKVNRDLEYKIAVISKKSGMDQTLIIKRAMEAFVMRYEAKHGLIMLPEMKNNPGAGIYTMYQLFKTRYNELFSVEYSVDLKQEKMDMRTIKLIREKIISAVMGKEKTDVVVINEPDMFNAFDFFLQKMPDWWKKNCFNLKMINSNFDKILNQIQYGKQSGKAALDDFISGLSAKFKGQGP